MRIATSQLYDLNTHNLMRLQSNANETLTSLSSGKKIETAADDPVASVVLENLKQQDVQLEQYKSNISLARNRLSQHEGSLAEYENLVMNAKDLMLQGNNGVMSDNDRLAISKDLTATRDGLLGVANRQDESGNYLFGGHQIGEKPFVKNPSGDVSYRGDDGIRNALVADGINVPVSASGNAVFMQVPNSSGDYRADYQNATMTESWFVENATVVNPGAHVASDHVINFIDDGSGGVNVEVRDGGGTVLLASQPFDPASTLSFNGMEIDISGAPRIGDTVTLENQPEIDVFASMQQAIDMLEHSDISTPVEQAEYAQAIADMTQALNHASVTRAESGNSLKLLDTYESQHANLGVITETVKSDLEDLDYAEATANFQKQQLALEAVSKTFGMMTSFSLFDYL